MLQKDKKLYFARLGDSGVSCNSCHSNPCSVKSIEYLEPLFISLVSPMVPPERGHFQTDQRLLIE